LHRPSDGPSDRQTGRLRRGRRKNDPKRPRAPRPRWRSTASPTGQDLTDVNARHAREQGAPLAVNTDAHATEHLDFMSTAVTVARRAWLRKEDILNTKNLAELKQWLDD